LLRNRPLRLYETLGSNRALRRYFEFLHLVEPIEEAGDLAKPRPNLVRPARNP
jgi:hypothetical protein